jgi:hypothetical protein
MHAALFLDEIPTVPVSWHERQTELVKLGELVGLKIEQAR